MMGLKRALKLIRTDPTRVPDVTQLKREDIEDLVVRRFRSSPEVIEAIGEKTLSRQLFRQDFDLSKEEEVVYEAIAELNLDLDEEQRSNKAIDLFRTTPPSLFSPALRRTSDIEIHKAHTCWNCTRYPGRCCKARAPTTAS